MFESGSLFDRHVKPESFKLSDMAANGTFGMPPVEIVRAELAVGDAVTHDVIGDFENLMPDGHDGFLVSPMALDPVVARLQSRTVLAGGGQAGLNQCRPQIAIPFAGFATAPLARAFVVAGTHGRPTAQMTRRGKAVHVGAGFSHD